MHAARLAFVLAAVFVPVSAEGIDVLVNNGLSESENVLSTGEPALELYIRNVGCGTPGIADPCASPGGPTGASLVPVAVVKAVRVFDSSTLFVTNIDFENVNFEAFFLHNDATMFVSDVLVTDVNSISFVDDDSHLTVSGSTLVPITGPIYARDRSRVTLSGGRVTSLTMQGTSELAVSGGQHPRIELTNLTTGVFTGGSQGGGNLITLRDNADAIFTGGIWEELEIPSGDAPTIRIDGNAEIRQDLFISGLTRLEMAGGILRLGLTAADSAEVEWSGGAIQGPIVGSGGSAVITWRGGTVNDPNGRILATDSSRIEIIGDDFRVDGTPVPFGDLTPLQGTLTGNLQSGDPIDILFNQGGAAFTGTIRLWSGSPPPLPSSSLSFLALVTASLAYLGTRASSYALARQQDSESRAS